MSPKKTHGFRPLRRMVLGALSLLALAPAFGSGCGGGFAPITLIDGLRVISVVADHPYAAPGQTVSFQMTWGDSAGSTRPAPTIVWLAGCFNPPGDQYFGCYAQLAALFQSGFDPQHPPPGLVGIGERFSLTLPDDIISRRPEPPAGTPRYGLAYVFFAACAGKLGVAPTEGTSLAGSFPLGCFDDEGNRLGADSFVAGLTQVYAFGDERVNENPTIEGMKLDGELIEDGPSGAASVDICPVSEEDRLGPPGCSKQNPYTECTAYHITVEVPEDVADVDPEGQSTDGKPLHEVVWVDYFADQGTLDSPTRLITDAVTGYQKNHGTHFVPPKDPGLVTVWAVVRDARGGGAVITRYLKVK